MFPSTNAEAACTHALTQTLNGEKEKDIDQKRHSTHTHRGGKKQTGIVPS